MMQACMLRSCCSLGETSLHHQDKTHVIPIWQLVISVHGTAAVSGCDHLCSRRISFGTDIELTERQIAQIIVSLLNRGNYQISFLGPRRSASTDWPAYYIVNIY